LQMSTLERCSSIVSNMESSLQRNVAIALVGSLYLFVSSVSAKSFRWKDKEGNTHYGATVPAEYADQPYDILNNAGIVIEHVEDTREPLEVRAARKIKERAPLISDEQRRQQTDRLLVIQYDSEADIQKALDLAIAQLGFESKMILKSSESASTAIRDQVRLAADQQRAGRQIGKEQQIKIDRLYQRLALDERKISALDEKVARIRTRFDSVFERYRVLTTQDQESDTEQVDQG